MLGGPVDPHGMSVITQDNAHIIVHIFITSKILFGSLVSLYVKAKL